MVNQQTERQPEHLQATRIVFIGEQDGPPERELKNRLELLFATERDVFRAYLARISYVNSERSSVALCLRVRVALDRNRLERIGKVFVAMFGRHEHLDIIIISTSQERELKQCCKPFFNAAP